MPAGRRELLLDIAGGVLVLAAYALGQLFFLLGPQPFDPAEYFDTGVEFPDIRANRWTLRSGLIAPVRVAVLVLGPTEAALYAVPLVTGLALAGSIYVTMVVLFRRRVLAAAAALVATLNPNYLLNGSFIFPDTTATATLTAGFLFLILGSPEFTRFGRGWPGAVAAAAAGLLFGWSYLVRELSPMLLPAVVIALWLVRYPLRRVALVAAAAIVTAGFELLYGYVLFGEPLIHLRKLLAHRGGRFVQEELDSVLDIFTLFPQLLATWRFGWLFIVLIAWFIAALVWFRDRRLWLFASWLFVFWGVLLVLGLASLPSGKWLLNVSNIRYWYPAFPPLVMGAFGALALVGERFWPGRRGAFVSAGVGAALALLILVPGFVQFDRCEAKEVWRNDPMARWHELREWFATGAAADYSTLWTDGQSRKLVPAYVRTTFGDLLWSGDVRFEPRRIRLGHVRSAEGLILVHNRLSTVRNDDARLEELRDDWRPVFESDDGRMVVLARTSTGEPPASAAEPWWELPPPAPRPAGCGLRPGED